MCTIFLDSSPSLPRNFSSAPENKFFKYFISEYRYSEITTKIKNQQKSSRR